jgi:hypothetical protein
MLQLERRDHERESDFNVLFVLRKHEEQGSYVGKTVPTSFLYTLSTTKICSVRLTTAWKDCTASSPPSQENTNLSCHRRHGQLQGVPEVMSAFIQQPALRLVRPNAFKAGKSSWDRS